MKSLLPLLLIGLVHIMACTSDEDPDNLPYLIFGHFYGECDGEGCIETFKIDSEKLYEDTKDLYAAEEYDFIQLPDSLHDKVVYLLDAIPSELISTENQTFGCPDCADGGGVLIRYANSENSEKAWLIDQDKANIPGYLHDFIDQVNTSIGLINE